VAEPLIDQQLKGIAEELLEIFALGNKIGLAVQVDEHSVLSCGVDGESPELREEKVLLLSHLLLPSSQRRQDSFL